MSKRYRIYVNKFKSNTEELELIGNPTITKESEKCVLIEYDHEITAEEQAQLHGLKEGLELTKKEEYALLSETEQKAYIEKRLGLR